MAKIYLDNDLPTDLTQILSQRGHTVWHTRFEGMTNAKDSHQLLFAVEREAVLVTHNGRDYELVNDAWHRWSIAWGVTPVHAGILVVPQNLTKEYLARRIDEQLPRTEINQLYELVAPGYVWRHIPFRSAPGR